jgi:hypothetical protein
MLVDRGRILEVEAKNLVASIVGDGVCDVIEESVEDLGGVVHHLLGLEAVLVGLRREFGPGFRVLRCRGNSSQHRSWV